MEKEVRNHFSMIILNTIKYAWFILLSLVVSFLPGGDAADGEFGFWGTLLAPVLTLIFVAIFLAEVIRWRKTFILIDDGQLIIDKRFRIMKSKTTVRLSSIASVNLKQNILEQILNVYNVQLDINSSVTANKTDFNLVFKEEVALEFKRMITEKKRESELREGENDSGRPSAVVQTETPAEDNRRIPIIYFSLSKVVRHCLLSLSITGILFSLLIFIGVITDLLLPEEGAASGPSMIFKILFVLLPVLVQCVSPVLRYYGFAVSKQDQQVVVSYGLFTKQQFTLPLDKTSALIIRQTMFSRLAGLYYGEIINVGMGNEEKNESPVFCLMVTKRELDAIIQQIAPAYIISEPVQPSPRSALLPVMIKYALFGIPVLVVSIVLGFWWVGVILLALVLLAGFLSYKTKELGLLEDRAAITSGIFAKKTIVIEYGKIQNLEVVNGPVSRRLGLCKGSVNILAARTNTSHSIGYFKEEQFENLSNAIIKHESL